MKHPFFPRVPPFSSRNQNDNWILIREPKQEATQSSHLRQSTSVFVEWLYRLGSIQQPPKYANKAVLSLRTISMGQNSSTNVRRKKCTACLWSVPAAAILPSFCSLFNLFTESDKDVSRSIKTKFSPC